MALRKDGATPRKDGELGMQAAWAALQAEFISSSWLQNVGCSATMNETVPEQRVRLPPSPQK